MKIPQLTIQQPLIELSPDKVVVELLIEKKLQGCALIGIFHDEEARNSLCSKELMFKAN